jgi:hypothetical protein
MYRSIPSFCEYLLVRHVTQKLPKALTPSPSPAGEGNKKKQESCSPSPAGEGAGG